MSVDTLIQLPPPVALGEVNPELVDALFANMRDGQQTGTEFGINPLLDPHFERLAEPVGELLETTEGLPLGSVEIYRQSARKSFSRPGTSLNVGASFWHVDRVSLATDYFVTLTDACPTEILTGDITLDEALEFIGGWALNAFRDSVDYSELATALKLKADDKPLPGRLAISQLRPYVAYLMTDRSIHRAPNNDTDEVIVRSLAKLSYKRTRQE
jgi:hypothetical protein